MYSPQIKPEQIKQLYALRETTAIPMTKLVEQALKEFFKKHKKTIKKYYDGQNNQDK